MARDRNFSKAMRRVREKMQPLLDAFAEVEMVDPIYEAILVGITDDQPASYFHEVDNSDGVFQVMAGADFKDSDDELVKSVFAILQRASAACPFSHQDREAFDSLFDRMRPSIFN